MRRIELFWEESISLNWDSKLVFSVVKINIHLLMLIRNKILQVSPLKVSFHTDRYCQILIQLYKHRILIEHIHHLKGIYRIILDSSLGICVLACHYIAGDPFQLKVTWKCLDCAVQWIWHMENPLRKLSSEKHC